MEVINDFDTSVRKALSEIDADWETYPGLIVCGSHSFTTAEEAIRKIQVARENKVPMLGICFGHQLAAIEYARNVLGIKDATSEEFGQGTFVVKKRKEPKVGWFEGESWWSYYDVAIDWEKPDYFITVPYHPEYQSSRFRPHPVLESFIELCKHTAVQLPV